MKIGLSCRTHVITEKLAPEKEVGEDVKDRGDGGDEDLLWWGSSSIDAVGDMAINKCRQEIVKGSIYIYSE